MSVRVSGVDDARACARIYAPFVRDTAVSFETVAPDTSVMADRIDSAISWWVAEESSEVVGYAYATPHRERPAYRWACEVSVYLSPSARGRGLGRSLYRALFADVAGRGYVTALAGVALPNEASLGLHRAVGFRTVGTFEAIGFKLGRWHDVCWLQRLLVPPPDVTEEPGGELPR